VAARTLNIVIDADIARSSGESEHPISSSSRKLLEMVKDKGHYIAMCPLLRAEWSKHKSIYARKWLASMFAKKKVNFVVHKSEFKAFIEENLLEDKMKKIASKDSHLVDAALLTDKVITSNDSTARKAFCEISSKNKILEEIIWLHSSTDNNFIEIFFSRDCFVPPEKFLRK